MTVSSALNIRRCEALHLFMFVFTDGSANFSFVVGLIINTDTKTFCLGDTFVTFFCIVSFDSFSFSLFFSFMSRELNMIVMCHNVIVLI